MGQRAAEASARPRIELGGAGGWHSHIVDDWPRRFLGVSSRRSARCGFGGHVGVDLIFGRIRNERRRFVAGGAPLQSAPRLSI